MNNEGMKEVYFDKYCKSCEHWESPEDEDPCDSCLCETMNYNSHKPVKWEER